MHLVVSVPFQTNLESARVAPERFTIDTLTEEVRTCNCYMRKLSTLISRRGSQSITVWPLVIVKGTWDDRTSDMQVKSRAGLQSCCLSTQRLHSESNHWLISCRGKIHSFVLCYIHPGTQDTVLYDCTNKLVVKINNTVVVWDSVSMTIN